MQTTSLLSESFYSDPWTPLTPDTPSGEGTDLWQRNLTNESSKINIRKFENDFAPQEKSFPVHLKPCPELPPPLDLDKGLKRMENKLKRIQKGRTPNKLSPRDIINRLNSSRDDTLSNSTYITSDPTVTVYTTHQGTQPTHGSSILCCWRWRRHDATERMEARYTSEIEVRDTIPLIMGDELLDDV